MIVRQFSGGWKRDTPDHRDIICRMGKKRGVSLTNVDLRTSNLLPPIYDQGDTQTCTAQALAAAVEYGRRKEGLSDFMPSRLFIYYAERDIENTINRPEAGARPRD